MAKRRTRTALGGLLLAIASCVLSAGCGGPGAATKQDENSRARLKALAVLVSEYASANSGRLPSDEGQLKTFIRQKGARTVAGLGSIGVDDLFVSARDGLPFVVAYGQKSGSGTALAPDAIIAYEKVGVSGKRLVALPSGGVTELDEAEFATATSGGVANAN